MTNVTQNPAVLSRLSVVCGCGCGWVGVSACVGMGLSACVCVCMRGLGIFLDPTKYTLFYAICDILTF